MTLLASLIALGGIVGAAAVERVVIGAPLSVTLAWRFAVFLPIIGALLLLWYDHGGPLGVVMVYAVADLGVRLWSSRRAARVARPSS